MESIRPLHVNSSKQPDASVIIAEVTTLKRGLVTEVCYCQQPLHIDACVHSPVAYQAGDQVIVQRIGSQWVVVNRLAKATDALPPTLTFDGERWCLQSECAYTLQVGQAELSISPIGDVTISAKDILTDASGVNRILGSRVELN